MQIKDLTPQELQNLIRNTVDDSLDEYFGDPDEGKQVKASFKQKLLEIRQKRLEGRPTIPASEVYKRYGIGISRTCGDQKRGRKHCAPTGRAQCLRPKCNMDEHFTP